MMLRVPCVGKRLGEGSPSPNASIPLGWRRHLGGSSTDVLGARHAVGAPPIALGPGRAPRIGRAPSEGSENEEGYLIFKMQQNDE